MFLSVWVNYCPVPVMDFRPVLGVPSSRPVTAGNRHQLPVTQNEEAGKEHGCFTFKIDAGKKKKKTCSTFHRINKNRLKDVKTDDS